MGEVNEEADEPLVSRRDLVSLRLELARLYLALRTTSCDIGRFGDHQTLR